MKQWIKSACIAMFIMLIACEQQPERVVAEQWTESQPKLVEYYVIQDNTRTKLKEEKFYRDGTREYFGSFDALGRRDGEWRYFYPNGQLWSLGHYQNGKKEGKKEVYWQDGTKRYEGQFKADQKDGTWIFYNEDGSVLQKKDF